MKEQLIYKKGANVWFIISGILFLLRPLGEIFQNVLNLILRLVLRDQYNILSTVFTPNAAIIFRILVPALFVSFIFIILGIGSLLSKKTLVVMTIGLFTNILYTFVMMIVDTISSLYNFSIIISYGGGTISLVMPVIRTILSLTVLVITLVALVLMALSTCFKLKKRKLSVIAAIIYIVGTLINILLYLVFIISDALAGGLFKIQIFYLINDFEAIVSVILCALPFIFYFLFAARRKIEYINDSEN